MIENTKTNYKKLENYSLTQLAEIYNDNVIPEKRIKKFSDKESALKRVTSLLMLKENSPAIKNKPSSSNNQKLIVGRKSRLTGKYLYKLIDKNPRRVDTHGFKAFEALKDGMTYEDYIKAKGNNNHILFDIKKGYVEVLANPKIKNGK